MKLIVSLAAIGSISANNESVQVPRTMSENIARNLMNTPASQKTAVAQAVPRSSDGKSLPPATLVDNTKVWNLLELEGPTGNSLAPRFGLIFRIPVVNNYGCWCYGGEYWPGARDKTGLGEPVDIYDDACKAHHMGFDCITMDANAEGETCIPNETTYSLLVTPQSNGDYTLECANSIEDDWCKRRVCMVDIRFIARHWKLESDGILPDYSAYGHSGFHGNAGDFNTDQCVVKTGPHNGNGARGPIVKVCCGDYPYRIWYNKANNKGISCCAYDDAQVNADYGFNLKVGQLFNSMSATCCSDGVVSGSNICS